MRYRLAMLLLAVSLASVAPAWAQSDEPPAQSPTDAVRPADDTVAAPSDEAIAQTIIQGISFGTPSLITAGSLRTLAVLVANDNPEPRTFTVRASYVRDEQVLGTATASVNDLSPGQTRVARLLVRQGAPASTNGWQFEVRNMRLSVATRAQAATAISFDNAVITSTYGLTSVDVDVRNDDDSAHTFTILAGFLNGDVVTGFATGAVNNLGPSETRRVNLLLHGDTTGADSSLFAVETLSR